MIDKLNAENESLKKQMENKHETLKRDNVWLVNAVQGLKDETMELQRYNNDQSLSKQLAVLIKNM